MDERRKYRIKKKGETMCTRSFRRTSFVTIILTGRPGADLACPAGGPTAMTMDLPDAIGARALLDGSVFPARDAATEPLGFGGTGG